MKPIFIAEIKIKSPYGYQSKNTFAQLMEIAISKGDYISVHTNALWGGDFNSISFVRQHTDKPILAKGFHSEDDAKRAIDHGADYVMFIDRIPTSFNLSHSLIEISDLNDDWISTSQFPKLKIVHNSRNLKTGLFKENNDLEKYIEKGYWVCQASGIKHPDDVNPHVDAFIVGEHLIDFCRENAK